MVLVHERDPERIIDRFADVFEQLSVAVQSGNDTWGGQHFPYANTPQVVGEFLKDCPRAP